MTLHPCTRVCLWLAFVFNIQYCAIQWLAIFVLSAIILALTLNTQRWFAMLRRTRWLSLSLLLIYGYATAGVACWPALAEWSPTQEGLLDGLLQLARLHSVLAALSILLSSLSQQQLMAGLYLAAFPLRLLAISPERLVVRIALTLSYAENTMNNLKLHSLSDFRALFDREDRPAETIELPMSRLHSLDILVLIIALGLLIGIMR